ncbi:hypothetical protein MPTK1_5g02240 [Marchantia polymorpha subsp. ruderalis]|nr:hypothetical protein MARPO_0147s0017 [Marchantia polymorpha]BBN10266.1 hypothetical protein Mp_5g02240 [Marchantia polymorpha subsp. ruderalis]|eukprot:PTQ29127.1 hypothetical protein MARPO_0147s0017 [Marchantia polymorpha]
MQRSMLPEFSENSSGLFVPETADVDEEPRPYLPRAASMPSLSSLLYGDMVEPLAPTASSESQFDRFTYETQGGIDRDSGSGMTLRSHSNRHRSAHPRGRTSRHVYPRVRKNHAPSLEKFFHQIFRSSGAKSGSNLEVNPPIACSHAQIPRGLPKLESSELAEDCDFVMNTGMRDRGKEVILAEGASRRTENAIPSQITASSSFSDPVDSVAEELANNCAIVDANQLHALQHEPTSQGKPDFDDFEMA